jgi:hypothetical protein
MMMVFVSRVLAAAQDALRQPASVADDFDPSNRFEQVLPTRGSQRAGDGMHVAWLDHVRYERHADHHPDEIVVRRRRLLPKRSRQFLSARSRR